MMYNNIIIVDDEILEAQCLENAINWEDYNLHVTACFDNVYDALVHMENEKVDAVISDIKMPGINGIEFCSTVSEKYPDVVFVFLSAYKEFEYAKAAISYRALEYLTKPIDFNQLESLCTKLSNYFETETIEYPSIPIETLHYQQILTDFFVGRIGELSQLSETLYQKGLSNAFVNKNAAYISIFTENFVEFLSDKWEYSIDQAYAFILKSAETKGIMIVPLSYASGLIKALVLSLDDIEFSENLRKMQENAIKICKNQIEIDIEFDISRQSATLTELRNLINIEPINNGSSNKTDSSLIVSAKLYIEENYMHDISLFDISQHVGITPYYFCRIFKKETGVNFTGYLTETRINQAKKLLLETDLNNSEICDKVGINSTNYFHQLFKNHTGVTPHTFRKNR